MRIRKKFQGTIPKNKILDTYSTSKTDTYSCNKINSLIGAGGGTGGSSDLALERVYPVGSIYMSINDTNPRDLFGFGTWEQIKDRFLLGAGDTYVVGTTGGVAEHTLKVEEIPSHSHNQQTIGEDGNINPWVSSTTGGYSAGVLTKQQSAYYGTWDHIQVATQNRGGGQPHNNMPPYLAVYMWQRIG